MSSPAPAASRRADARLAGLIPKLVVIRREMARLQAEEASLLAEARRIADDWSAAEDAASQSTSEFPHRSVAAEIAAAWRVSDRTVQRQIDDAATLVEHYPETHAALASGQISAAHARTICEAGSIVVRAELRAEFEASVLDYAMTESASRLAPVAKRRAEWFAESTFDDRHRRARDGRRIWTGDFDDGMSELRLIGPSVLVHASFNRLTQLAHEASGMTRGDAAPDDHGTAGTAEPDVADSRTLDQLRADILLDLLLAADPVARDTGLAAIRATVSVTVPVLALIDDGIRDPFESMTLDGHGPIDTETARTLVGAASGWDRILTHPVTGAVLEVDRYTPSEQLRRHLRVRDQHCRFPGCRMPARRSDIDHTLDFSLGGQTTGSNLAHLCRRHHTLKHHTPWRVVQHPGGVLEWTSPAGIAYIDRPVSTVAFAPDAESEYAAAPF
jgi:hypothetical protein